MSIGFSSVMIKGILLYCSMNAFFTGQIIEEARKKANMTQAELAEKIGTNKSYISRVETGKQSLRFLLFIVLLLLWD